ncbi:MAG: hypothetical protein ABUS54_13570 [Actinomycetota bacterium]
MSGPNFDELVGQDLDARERDRLRAVHEQLLAAGPPPELPPQLERGPTLGMTLNRKPTRVSRRVALLAAAICAFGVAFLLGYIAGNSGGGLARGTVLQLAGTKAAPSALASLKILPADTSGNWPMQLTGTGLPKLTGRGYYEVWLVRGKDWEPCGSFVAKGTSNGIDVTLNAPYRLRKGDRWLVTTQHRGDRKHGPVVLQPTNA